MTTITLPRAVVQQVRDTLNLIDKDIEWREPSATRKLVAKTIAALDEALAQPAPTPELPPLPDERAAFEAWASHRGGNINRHQDNASRYASSAVQGWWNAFQAGAALAQRSAALIDAARAQHDRDSAELRRLCQARDDARRERDLCRAEKAGLEASIGNLSRLIDDLRQGHDRYQYLRDRDLSAIDEGSIFAGLTPDNLVLNGDDLDAAIDAALANHPKEQKGGV